MKIKTLLLLAALGIGLPAVASQNRILSPTALAATSDGQRLFVANATADEVSVFDVATKTTTARIKVSGSPLGLAVSPDQQKLYVTCAAPESEIVVVDTAKLKVARSFRGGHTSMAPAVSPDGKFLFVCNRFNNEVALFDLKQQKQVARIPVGREPVAASITPDGKFLFVANHIHAGRSDVDVVSATVSVIDIKARCVVKEIELPNGSTLLRGVAVSPDGKYAAVTHILARFHLPTTQIERGWINNSALTLIDVTKLERLNTVLLDNVDSGAANPWAVEWSRDGKTICVTHAGTHELSVIDAPALLQKLAKVPAKAESQAYYNSVSRTAADVPNDLAFMLGVRERVRLDGKGPRAIALLANTAYVANYFSDSLSVLDLAAKRPGNKSVPLGSQKKISLVRQGEMNFNDGSVCFQGWQSCASCHSSDARVDGMNWDNLNDGIGNPKNVKSLLLAHRTAPSMWLSVRESAEVSVRAGIRNSLFVELPEDFAVAIDEYLKSLKPIPSPHLVKGRLSPAAQRGKKLFSNETVGCAECHKTTLFTDQKSHSVGTRGQFDKPGDKFDTPSLIEAWRTAPYLHDGSVVTIRDILTGNKNDEHGKTSHLTPQQLDDLTEYILSL